MLKLQDILRSGSVTRWHLVNTIKQQTLGQHQYNVAMLSLEIASRMGITDHSQLLSIIFYALTHDSSEARIGDIPTPTKRKLKERTGVDFNQVFMDFDVADSRMVDSTAQQIVKCADHLDGLFFLGEHRVGRHADKVMDDITTEAIAYFRGAGDTGAIATQILSEIENAVYEI